MSNGIIYFIQPSELVGTNRYKIGCSNSSKLDRPYYGYKKGTRYISINECVHPFILEKKIKDQFNKSFKLISGSEYFEGDEQLMKNTFIQILEKHAKTNNNVIKLKYLRECFNEKRLKLSELSFKINFPCKFY
jgi:hypothetical protein